MGLNIHLYKCTSDPRKINLINAQTIISAPSQYQQKNMTKYVTVPTG